MLHRDFGSSLVLTSATVVSVSTWKERIGIDSDLSLDWERGILCNLFAEVLVF